MPLEAEATPDIRKVPDEDGAKLHAKIREVINDPAVRVVRRGATRPEAPPSRFDAPLFQALEHVTKAMPRRVTLPTMLTDATDMAHLRARRVRFCGVGPIVDENDRIGAAHTDAGRLGEQSLYKPVEYMWNA